MAVEVYYWTPSIVPFLYGHAAVKIDGGSPAGSVYFSVWSDGPVSVFWGPGVLQAYADNIKAQNGRAPHITRFMRLNETAMKAWIAKNKLHFSALLQNC